MRKALLSEVVDINPETLSLSASGSFRFRYIDLSAVSRGQIFWNSLETHLRTSAPSRAQRLVRPNDCLLGTVRPLQQSHGYIEETGEALVASTGFAVLRAKDGIAHPRFIYHWMLGSSALRQTDAMAVGSNYPAVNESDVANLRIDLPSIGQQRRIAEILDTVDAYIDVSSDLVAKLLSLRTDLLEHLFSEKRWPTVRLGEICKITSGTTPSRAEGERYFAPKGIPWVKTLDLNEGTIVDADEKVTFEAVRDLRLRILPPGTVLVAMYGGWEQIGRTALLGVSATTNQAICALEASGELLPEFLLRALQQKRRQWRKIAASTRKDPNITKRDVHTFQVPMPPVQDQERIIRSYSSHLERITNEIQSKNRLEIFKRGLMEDLLTGRVRVPQAEAVLEDL
ncbi:restriction endonuclease subunit S [Nonomuraea sp. B10E15]|uniref:restriction endonuclease subunit S n=1 Tax=Nonomuraea sp. B10E15 TaxID=3153560 RepID=UPI00325E6FDE